MRVTVAAAAISVTACSCGTDASPSRVMVPSSFAPVVEEIDRAWEADGRTPPEWIIAGSQRLVSQLADGAEADLLITADGASMDRAVELGLVVERLGIVARNRLVLAFTHGNPGGIESLDDLEDDALLLGVCAPEVPCGRLTATAAEALGLEIAADTEEPSVRSLAQKISRGELDGGLVYRTDAESFGLPTVDDERLTGFVNDYPAAAVRATDRAVITFLRSEEGRTVLTDAGFEVP